MIGRFCARTSLRIITAVLTAFMSIAVRAAAQAPAIRPLSYARLVLANGLTAIVNEDHTTPIAVVDVWFHVGSKDDKPGHTGMAHLCEHLSNMRVPYVDQPFNVFYSSLGGTSPHFGETTEDITHFFVSVPRNQLETVLWAESNRLVAPFAQVDSAQLAAAIAVIARERESNIDAIPFAVYREQTIGAMYPEPNPYHRTPLPPMTDLNHASVADVQSGCVPFYVPGNAVVSVSGDVSTAETKQLVAKYFGRLPRRPQPPRAGVTPAPLATEKRLVLEDKRATIPRLAISWPGAAFANRDRGALRAVAFALAAPRLGRLSTLLVEDRKLANNVLADNYDLEQGGVFEITVIPRPGASLTTIESLIDSVVATLPTATFTPHEIRRFSAFDRVSSTNALQSRFARADTLAQGEVFAGNPIAYAKQNAAARALRSTDLQRAARKYLTTSRVVMNMVPAGKLDLMSRPDLPYVNVTPTIVASPAVLP